MLPIVCLQAFANCAKEKRKTFSTSALSAIVLQIVGLHFFKFFLHQLGFWKNSHKQCFHILAGPKLKKNQQVPWSNRVKAMLTDLWFERNQRVFHDKETPGFTRFGASELNTSLWTSLSKAFADYSSQDINLSWSALISMN